MQTSTKSLAGAFIFVTALGITSCSKDDNGPVGPAGAPEPVVTEYTRAQTGWRTSSGTNLVSTVTAQSPVPGYAARMAGISTIWIGVYEHPVSITYLQNTHQGGPGNYRVESTYNWNGSIAGNGIAGAGARVEMVMQIVDFNGSLITSYNIHEKEVRESALQMGGIPDQGTNRIVVDFTLAQGKTGFNIRFLMRCEAWSGLFGAISQCHFGDTQSTGHYSGWTSLRVTQFPG